MVQNLNIEYCLLILVVVILVFLCYVVLFVVVYIEVFKFNLCGLLCFELLLLKWMVLEGWYYIFLFGYLIGILIVNLEVNFECIVLNIILIMMVMMFVQEGFFVNCDGCGLGQGLKDGVCKLIEVFESGVCSMVGIVIVIVVVGIIVGIVIIIGLGFGFVDVVESVVNLFQMFFFKVLVVLVMG